MTIKLKINNTSSNSFSIGDGLPTNVDGYLLFATGNTNKPGVKYDTVSSTVKFSNDGYVWSNVNSTTAALGGDLSGTISNASVVGFNGKALTTDVPGDGYAYVYSSSSSKFVPSKINNSCVITVGKQDLLTANATNYLLPNFVESTDETSIAFLAPVAGTISNLVVYSGTAPGGSETIVITVRKNSVDTTITGTITGAGTTCSDIINTASLASGDKITFKVVTSLNCTARDLFVSVIFTVPVSNNAITSGGGGSTSFGTFASMPASSSSGAIYIVSDSAIATWCYSGPSWRPIFKNVICTKPPIASSFTKINDGGANHTLIDNKGTLNFTCPNDGAHTYNRGYIVSYSNATAYVEIAQPLIPYIVASNYFYFGIIMRESGTAKSYSVGLRKENTNYMDIQTFFRTSDNDEGNYAIYAINNISDIIFLRIIRSGSNIISQYSIDRQNWIQIESKVTTAVFTTAPDQIGITGWGYNLIVSTPIYHFEYGSL